MSTYKDIHIGELLKNSIEEQNISIKKIQLHFKYSKNKINTIFQNTSLETNELLRWCKFLRIDFFRIFSGHLMLHHGISIKPSLKNSKSDSKITIRKNVYTLEIKQYIVDSIRAEKLTVLQAIKKYNIPKTTVYKWLHQI